MPYHLSKTSPDDYPCIPPSLFMDFPARITCESKPCVFALSTDCMLWLVLSQLLQVYHLLSLARLASEGHNSQHHPSLVNQQQLLRQYGCLGGADLMQECTQNLFFASEDWKPKWECCQTQHLLLHQKVVVNACHAKPTADSLVTVYSCAVFQARVNFKCQDQVCQPCSTWTTLLKIQSCASRRRQPISTNYIHWSVFKAEVKLTARFELFSILYLPLILQWHACIYSFVRLFACWFIFSSAHWLVHSFHKSIVR